MQTRGVELEKFSFSEDALESKSILKEGFECKADLESDACMWSWRLWSTISKFFKGRLESRAL